ncbi:fibronectin type III-like domain-contianing protein [Geodermatophilus sp. SYSU D00779]
MQVYAARPDGAVERPVRRLAGFAVAEADPAEEVAVTVELPERAYQHWDGAAHRWATEAGAFRLHVGPSSGVLPLVLDVHVQG